MAHDKRFMAQRRQRKRVKAVKAKIKQHEAGKLPYDKLPILARTLLSRKRRVLTRAE